MSLVKRLLKVVSNMFKSILGFECVSRSAIPPNNALSVSRDTIAVHNLATDGPLVFENNFCTMPVSSNTISSNFRENPSYDPNTGEILYDGVWEQDGYLADHRFFHLTTGQIIRIDRISFSEGPGLPFQAEVTFSTRQNRRTQAPFGESNNIYFTPNNPNTSANVAAGLNFKPINKIVVDFPYDNANQRTEVLEYTFADSDNFNDYGQISRVDDTNGGFTLATSKLIDGGVPHNHGTNTPGHTRPYRVTIT